MFSPCRIPCPRPFRPVPPTLGDPAVRPTGFSKSKSRGSLEAGADRAQFLTAVKEALQLSGPVLLVSPSASGAYSIPLLKRQPDWLAGYVPVAPVGTESLSPNVARTIKVRRAACQTACLTIQLLLSRRAPCFFVALNDPVLFF